MRRAAGTVALSLLASCGAVPRQQLTVPAPLEGEIVEEAEECRRDIWEAPGEIGKIWVALGLLLAPSRKRHGEEHNYPTKSAIELQPTLLPTGPGGRLTGAAAFTGASSF